MYLFACAKSKFSIFVQIQYMTSKYNTCDELIGNYTFQWKIIWPYHWKYNKFNDHRFEPFERQGDPDVFETLFDGINIALDFRGMFFFGSCI